MRNSVPKSDANCLTLPIFHLLICIKIFSKFDLDDFVFQYKKPPTILEMERTLQAEFSKLKATKDGDVDCTPS